MRGPSSGYSVNDFHFHFDLYPRPLGVLAETVKRNSFTLAVTSSPSAFSAASQRFSRHTNVAVAPGLHPAIAHIKKGELPLLIKQIQSSPFVGKVGLDGSLPCRAHWAVQLDVFRTAIRACAEVGGRVISVHSNKAPRAVLNVLEDMRRCGTPVLHWFSGPIVGLERAIALGCWFSVGPAMLVAARARDLVARMPRDRVVSETGGPYAGLNGRPLMRWHGETVPKVCARLWGIREDEAIRQLDTNAAVLRGLAPSLG
jgi:TatD DNase family protein